MFTRKEYMNGQATFEQYYEEIAAEAGISYDKSPKLDEIKAALAKGDEHLNTIPLHWWDRQCGAIAIGSDIQWFRKCSIALNKAFRDRGDYPTLAGLVCVHKAAARKSALKEMSHE